MPKSTQRSRHAQFVGMALAVALLAGLASTSSSAASGVTITIKNFQFLPTPAKVVVGQTVTWVNKDFGAHKIMFNDNLYRASALLQPGDRYSVKLTRAGTVNYFDGVASFVTGTIIVTAGSSSTPRPTVRPAPAATPKVTPKPTARATPKPTAKPAAATAKPTRTASPSATAAAVVESPGQSVAPVGGIAASSPDQGDTGSSPIGDSGPAGYLAILVFVFLALLAGVGFMMARRNRSAASLGPLAATTQVAPVVPVPPASSTRHPAPVRRAVPGQPRPVERAPSDAGPSYPYDVDEDAPIESKKPKPRAEEKPFTDGL